MPDEITDFISNRLDEDESLAERTLGRWRGKPNATYHTVARWERAQREAAVKRAVPGLHRIFAEAREFGGHWCSCGDLWPCKTIRLTAAVWSDHPDYRDEWKP